jgi:hypothetical protein
VAVLSLLRLGFSGGETPDPARGGVREALLRCLPLEASFSLFHRPEGAVERVGDWRRRTAGPLALVDVTPGLMVSE